MRWEQWRSRPDLPDDLDWESVPDHELGDAAEDADALVRAMLATSGGGVSGELSGELRGEPRGELGSPTPVTSLPAAVGPPPRSMGTARSDRYRNLLLAASVFVLIIGVAVGVSAFQVGKTGRTISGDLTATSPSDEVFYSDDRRFGFAIESFDQCGLGFAFLPAQGETVTIQVIGDFPEAVSSTRLSVLPPVHAPVAVDPEWYSTGIPVVREVLGELEVGRSHVFVVEAFDGDGGLVDCAVSKPTRACTAANWTVPPVLSPSVEGFELAWNGLTDFCALGSQIEYRVFEGEATTDRLRGVTSMTIVGTPDVAELSVEACNQFSCATQSALPADRCVEEVAQLQSLDEQRRRQIDSLLWREAARLNNVLSGDNPNPGPDLAAWADDDLDSRRRELTALHEQITELSAALLSGNCFGK